MQTIPQLALLNAAEEAYAYTAKEIAILAICANGDANSSMRNAQSEALAKQAEDLLCKAAQLYAQIAALED